MLWVDFDKEIQRIPIKSWCPKDYMGNAELQALNLSKHPVLFRHVALMGDAGKGYGMPNGSVIACKNAVIPYAVGKDGGCGMRFVKTNLKLDYFHNNYQSLIDIIGLIGENIPVGFNHRETPLENKLIWPKKDLPVTKQERESIPYQLGTVGGGNHFIEVQYDVNTKDIYFMLHSGSRNFGSKVCDYYNKLAIHLNEIWHSEVEKSWELAFLPIGVRETSDYIKEMQFCKRFALENRRLMAEEIKKIFLSVFPNCEFTFEYDIHHNYASLEHHFGKDVWVHRKGAISARKNEMGIIPGTMGDSSFITKGLGNKESFMSSSHGAGRVRSCTESSEILSKNVCDYAMKNIIFPEWGVNRKGKVDLSEAPGAYKDIRSVMEFQRDLTVPIIELKPLGVVKDIKYSEEK